MAAAPDEILGIGRKFMESRIFLSAAELDLFTLLANNPCTSDEIADKLKITHRGTRILLDAVCAMGLLGKNNGKYLCPADLVPFLSKDSPTSIIPMVLHSASLWKRWSDLTEIVRHGSARTKPSVFESSDSDREAFIGAMHVVSSRVAPGIAAAVKPGNAKKLLDIGGASGSYTQAFLEACPGMTATIYDLPPVIEIAKRRLAPTGLLDRITLQAGDFYIDPLPEGSDLVLLSAIIHQNSTEQNIDLYKKIIGAMAGGGRLIIRDHIMNDDHTAPAAGAIFAVNMLVGTPAGGTYTFEEIKSSLETAGFVRVSQIKHDDRMSGLVEAFKK